MLAQFILTKTIKLGQQNSKRWLNNATIWLDQVKLCRQIIF